MLSSTIQKFKYGKHTVTLETGMMARQSTAAVMVSMDDTVVFVSVVGAKQEKLNQGFFPLTVNYQERSYAAGRFPKGFFRREGRPSENEILISRLIDRSIRPLFPENFLNEVQVIATVISLNPQINPDIVSIIGTSTALSLSGIPFNGPIGVARVGYIDNEYVLNPTVIEMVGSCLDLVITSTSDAVLMIESEAKILTESQMLNALEFGYKNQQIVIQNINILVNKIGKPKWQWKAKKIDISIQSYVTELIESSLNDAYSIFEKEERQNKIHSIKLDTMNQLKNEEKILDENEYYNIFNALEKKIVRNRILQGKPRIDGRKKDMIRSLDVRVGILPRAHGSALFTRGETQALVTVTLGTDRDAQNLDDLIGERVDRFLLHYNFPPYCVGEIGIIGSPKRREIGHGRLAKKGLMSVIPIESSKFPYTIRVVSEITESNGSSSIASVCGASLALMDAGVPIKCSIAGIAMGLIKEGDNFIILSDIISDEDHFGDMDFKIAGSYEGITAMQMDTKIGSITLDIISEVLNQSNSAKIHVLNIMEKVIKFPRLEISKFAPRIYTIKINPDKIRNIVGKGGSVIRSLIEETGTVIEIEDNGTIKIASSNNDKICYAIKRIKEITAEIEVGRTYNGKVTRIVDFGAFVSIPNGKEGLVHISQITNKHVKKVTDYLKLGQEVIVKVIEIDRQKRIRLSIKESSNDYSIKENVILID